MKLVRLVVVVSLITALSAGAGALLGMLAGRRTTLLGATVVGTIGLLVAIQIVVRMNWFNPDRTRGGAIGGLVGFGVGAPLAVMAPDQPLMLLVGTLLIGVGVIAGAGPASAR